MMMEALNNNESSPQFVYAVIYIWINKINGKAYIGQTINEKERYRKHILESFNQNQKGYNYYIHRAIRKYGLDNFIYKVLRRIRIPKEFSKDVLNAMESYYIELFGTYKDGYNLTKGGDGSYGHNWSEEERKHHSEMLKGKMSGSKNPMYGTKWNKKQREANQTKVLKYTLDGEFVGEFDSMKDAAKSVNLNHTGNISSCCRGKRNNAYGFIWKYK